MTKHLLRQFPLTLILIFSLGLPTVFPKEQPKFDKKKLCQEALAEKKELEKERKGILEEKSRLDGEYQKAEEKFQQFRMRFKPLVGCVYESPTKTPECETVLTGMRQATAELDQIQKELADVAQKKLAVENKLFKPEGAIKVYQCEN